MQNFNQPGGYAGAITTSRSGLYAKVGGLLAFAMAFTAAGAFVGAAVPALGLPAMIVALVLSFALAFVRNVPFVNLAVMYTFTTLIGVGLGGILSQYIAAGAGIVVAQAAGTTMIITLGVSVYAVLTKRDFTGIGSWLFFALLALIGVSIVGIFVQASILQLAIGGVGAVLFSFYLIYYIQSARNTQDTLGNAILIAIGIYMAVVNIFLSLLRVFGVLGGSSRD